MSEVLPTDLVALGPDVFDVGLQWPRRHPLYSSSPVNSAIVAESVRQTTIYVCHAGYDAALGSRFLMSGLGFHIQPRQPEVRTRTAIEIIAHVRATKVRRAANGSLRSIRVNIEFTDDRGVLATGYGDALLTDERTYRRIRGDHAGSVAPAGRQPPSISAAAVGRSLQEDVVITSARAGLEVSVDGRNPFYYDHPLDHIPGVALIEACRQTACLELGDPSADLRSFTGSFHRIVEFASPNEIELALGADARFELRQRGGVALEATAVIASDSAAYGAR